MDTVQVIAQAEDAIKIARLAAALKLATSCTVRRLAEDGFGNHREVVLVVPHDTAADALVAAIRAAVQ